MSNTPRPARILPDMANAAETFINPNAPALARLRALLALIVRLIASPHRAGAFNRLAEQADRLLAAHLFDLAIRLTGRTDLRATHEGAITWRGATLRFTIIAKPGALYPLHAVIARTRRARAIALYRTIIGCRHRCSSRPSRVRFNNQRRRQSAIATQRSASAAPPSHTPSRIAAPP